MRAVTALLFFVVLMSGIANAEGPEPITGSSVPVEPGAAGGEDAIKDAAQGLDYYSRDKRTVEGVVASVNAETATITIKTAEGNMPFVFDGDTRFQVGLKAVEVGKVTPGARMAGLYAEKDGQSYLIRGMVLKDVPAVSKKKKRKARSHRKKRRRR